MLTQPTSLGTDTQRWSGWPRTSAARMLPATRPGYGALCTPLSQLTRSAGIFRMQLVRAAIT